VLKRMRRSYRQTRFLSLMERVRQALPQAAITTDIIVGFPGETEAEFEETLAVVRQARFAQAFTFLYSIRPGTPAADMPDQVPPAVKQERYERLVELTGQIAWEENQTQIGREVEVLFAEGEGRKDSTRHRLSGRARDNRLVHVAVPEDPARRPRPGDVGRTVVTYAAPHHLVADSPITELQRTPGGDAWERAQGETGAVVLPLPRRRL